MYPSALNTLPFPNLWSIFFYLAMVTLGIDSQVFFFPKSKIQFGTVENVCATLEDEKVVFGYEMKPIYVRAGVSLVLAFIGFFYSFSNCYKVLEIADEFATVIPLMLTCFLEVYFFSLEFLPLNFSQNY